MNETKAVKTYANWRGSLDEYLQIGDLVDEEIADYFIEVLPPATWRADLIQMGEPHSHVGGRATYPTLQRTADGWKYIGNCHRGLTTPGAV